MREARAAAGTAAFLVVAPGVVAGLVLAALLTRFVRSQLFDISAHDPLVFAVVGPALLLVVAAASYLPARVASRTDPITVLQPE